jgi:hypothetical protein
MTAPTPPSPSAPLDLRAVLRGFGLALAAFLPSLLIALLPRVPRLLALFDDFVLRFLPVLAGALLVALTSRSARPTRKLLEAALAGGLFGLAWGVALSLLARALPAQMLGAALFSALLMALLFALVGGLAGYYQSHRRPNPPPA